MKIHVLKDGQPYGGYSREEIYIFLRQGLFNAEDFGWAEGMQDWKPLVELVPEVIARLQRSTPPTGKQPSSRRNTIPAIMVLCAVVAGAVIWFSPIGVRNPDHEQHPTVAQPPQSEHNLSVPLPAQARPEAFNLVEVARKSRSSIVLIEVFDESNKLTATGSGFFVSANGLLVTNFHVVENAHSVIAHSETGAMYPILGVLSANKESDIALLKADVKEMPFLALGDSSKEDEGEHIAVIGSPLGLEGSLAEGVISAKRQLPSGESWLQITAPISHGSSGSPVINSSGEVVGVATKLSEDGQALNFAVPIEAVKAAMAPLGNQSPLLPYPQAAAAPVASIVEINRVASNSPEGKAANDAVWDSVLSHKWQPALEASEVFVGKFPNASVSHFTLGVVDDALGFRDDAMDHFQKAIKLNPNDSGSWSYLGDLYFGAESPFQAANAYHQAIALKLQEMDQRSDGVEKSIALGAIGDLYEKVGDSTKAIATYRQAVSVWAQNNAAWSKLGRLYAVNGQVEDAVNSYHHALEDKRYSVACSVVYKILKSKGDKDGAAKCYQMMRKLMSQGE